MRHERNNFFRFNFLFYFLILLRFVYWCFMEIIYLAKRSAILVEYLYFVHCVFFDKERNKILTKIIILKKSAVENFLVRTWFDQVFNCTRRKIRTIKRFYDFHLKNVKDVIFVDLETFVNSIHPRNRPWHIFILDNFL